MAEMTRDEMDTSDKQTKELPRRGPVADPIPKESDIDPRTGGAQRQEDVEDRRVVSQVTPDDYPDDQKSSGTNNL